MAVDAVLIKPLSRRNSLLSGINTGIFMRFAENTLALSVNPREFR